MKGRGSRSTETTENQQPPVGLAGSPRHGREEAGARLARLVSEWDIVHSMEYDQGRNGKQRKWLLKAPSSKYCHKKNNETTKIDVERWRTGEMNEENEEEELQNNGDSREKRNEKTEN